MTKMKVAIIGGCMIELQQNGNALKRSFGGDTLNTAVYLSRLTKDKNIQTTYVTALGVDSFSCDMLKAWKNEGIDISEVLQLKDKNPGLYYIETDDTGERSFYYWRNDAAAKYLLEQPESDKLLMDLLDFDVVYLSGISLAILTQQSRDKLFDFLGAFKAKGGRVMFDNNYRPKLWSSKDEAITNYLKMLSFTDIALLTFDDEQMLYGDDDKQTCINRTQSLGVNEIAIKMGADACLVIIADEITPVPCIVTNNVIDTTAAGDSFSGGYLAKRLTGGTAVESALAGHKVASKVIQYRGAIIPIQGMPVIF